MRKMEYLDLATNVTDLRIPPSNRLRRLERDKAGQYSISVNNQWRICFRFEDGDAFDVPLVLRDEAQADDRAAERCEQDADVMPAADGADEGGERRERDQPALPDVRVEREHGSQAKRCGATMPQRMYVD